MTDYAPLEWQTGLGYRVDETRCRAAVHNDYGVGHHQCQRKPAQGERYCKTHLPANIQKRREESLQRYNERWAAERRRRVAIAGAPFIEALRQIAKGHNDPEFYNRWVAFARKTFC